MPQRSNVFVSYSHRDKVWLDRLYVHLRPLERPPHRIVIWSDRSLRPGSRWKEEIQEALASARVAVLLISADFLSSDFITENELPPLLKAAEGQGSVVLPVILKPCRFLRTDNLNQFQAINDPRTQPLSRLSEADQEEIFDRLSEEIENILCRLPAQPSAPATPTSEKSLNPDVVEKISVKKRGKVLAIDTPRFNQTYRFETFVQGKSNEFAFAAARAVAERPAQSYNPLFLHGGTGLGKTHLLHAIGHVIHKARPELRVLYLSAEQFVNEMIEAIRSHRLAAFQEHYRTIDVLMIDDVQFLASRERGQEEFYHTFNTLYASDKQIILSSDAPPRTISALEERLRSRLEGGLIVDISPPDLETKIAILQHKCALENVILPLDVSEFIANQARSSVRELEGLLNRVLAYVSFKGMPISVASVREALQEIVPL
jgi:chromosomal replication initiator protein DnaA